MQEAPVHPALDMMLQAVCTNATVALFVMNEQQHCVYMNPAAEQLTGFRLDEVQGRPLHDLIHHTHPDGRPYPLQDCPIDRAFPQDDQVQGEEVFIHKDGHFYPVAFTASPLRIQGRPAGTVIEVRDISAEKAQAAEREVMKDIGLVILKELEVDRIVQAVTDAGTRLTRAQCGAFFYNVTDEQGDSFLLYSLSGVPREAFDRFPNPRPTALFGPTFRGEGTIRSADILADPRYGLSAPWRGMPPGHLPVRSYLAVPVTSETGDIIGGLFFGHADPGVFQPQDEQVVETLAAYAAIGLTKAQLFQAARRDHERAAKAAEESRRLYLQAEEASRLKDEFLATVSHELRTPLSAILGWTRLLASGKLDEAAARKAVDTVDRNARVQAQIIEDLLDISRIVSGKLRLDVQLCMPGSAVEAAVEAMRPAADARQVTLQLLADPNAGPVSGDPERLQQIVWNLVSNAVKFTPKGGKVQVTVQRVHSQVEVVVADTGQGIEPDFLPRVFDRFTQADASSTRSHGGLGLGLAIVRQLTEMHGGHVSASSPGPGLGAVFTVSLPLAVVASAPAAARSPETHPGRSARAVPLPEVDLQACRILVVDDDDDTREMLCWVLEQCHAHVRCCASGAEALASWLAFAPELLISDIGMPEMDGYTLIEQLRALETAQGLPPVPAVALTAYARVEDRMTALARGFQMHVAKPVEPAELVAVVTAMREWMPRHRRPG